MPKYSVPMVKRLVVYGDIEVNATSAKAAARKVRKYMKAMDALQHDDPRIKWRLPVYDDFSFDIDDVRFPERV